MVASVRDAAELDAATGSDSDTVRGRGRGGGRGRRGVGGVRVVTAEAAAAAVAEAIITHAGGRVGVGVRYTTWSHGTTMPMKGIGQQRDSVVVLVVRVGGGGDTVRAGIHPRSVVQIRHGDVVQGIVAGGTTGIEHLLVAGERGSITCIVIVVIKLVIEGVTIGVIAMMTLRLLLLPGLI